LKILKKISRCLGIKRWRNLSKEMTEWRRITKKAKTHSGL
jgi:hypothetical protein